MTRVLFVADQFSDVSRSAKDRHPGGAELTDEAAILACPYRLETRTCRALSRENGRFLAGFDVIVVGNARTASRELVDRIASTSRHVIFEHDLRPCRFRGNFPVALDPVHRNEQRCWCPHLRVRSLFDRARGVIFLTSLQRRYYEANPYFFSARSFVLGSSLFGHAVLDGLNRPNNASRSGTCVFASPHAIKGYRESLAYCKVSDRSPIIIKDLKPADVLDVFSRTKRFVYLPIGPEWAGRMVVEARVQGCQVVVNDLVGVAGEPFWRGPRAEALEFLEAGPRRFWSQVDALMNDGVESVPRAISLRDRAVDALSLLVHAMPTPRTRAVQAARAHAIRSYDPW